MQQKSKGRNPQGNTEYLRVLISASDGRFLRALAVADGTNVSEVVRRQIKSMRENASRVISASTGTGN